MKKVLCLGMLALLYAQNVEAIWPFDAWRVERGEPPCCRLQRLVALADFSDPMSDRGAALRAFKSENPQDEGRCADLLDYLEKLPKMPQRNRFVRREDDLSEHWVAGVHDN